MADSKKDKYINVAGFLINIILKKTNENKVFESFEVNTLSFLKDFTCPSPISDVDFMIEVTDSTLNLTESGVLNLTKINKKNRIYITPNIDSFRFQMLIQNILYKLLSKSGFLLHASASRINGKVHLFLGKPGAGKSTVVNLLEGTFPALTDDLSIIRKVKNKYFLYQHPFVEKNPIRDKTTEEYAIDNLFFIKKSRQFKIKSIHNKQIVLDKLIKQLVTPNKKMVKNLMEFTSSFDNSYLLYFAKDKKKLSKLIGDHVKG